MLFSKEYVGYLAREVSKKLVASGLIETKAMPALSEKVHSAMLDELSLEDRINDEVRVILEAYSEEMQKSGANYQVPIQFPFDCIARTWRHSIAHFMLRRRRLPRTAAYSSP